MTDSLEASQAREKVLRDALNNQLNDCINFDGGKLTIQVMEASTSVLNQPADDTALRAALKAERERVAKHFESRSYLGSGHQLAIEIRALEDE